MEKVADGRDIEHYLVRTAPLDQSVDVGHTKVAASSALAACACVNIYACVVIGELLSVPTVRLRTIEVALP